MASARNSLPFLANHVSFNPYRQATSLIWQVLKDSQDRERGIWLCVSSREQRERKALCVEGGTHTTVLHTCLDVLFQVNIRGIPYDEQQNALKEVAILRKLRHPNIIAYKDSYVDQGNLAIIMEFAQARSTAHHTTNRSISVVAGWGPA